MTCVVLAHEYMYVPGFKVNRQTYAKQLHMIVSSYGLVKLEIDRTREGIGVTFVMVSWAELVNLPDDTSFPKVHSDSELSTAGS